MNFSEDYLVGGGGGGGGCSKNFHHIHSFMGEYEYNFVKIEAQLQQSYFFFVRRKRKSGCVT